MTTLPGFAFAAMLFFAHAVQDARPSSEPSAAETEARSAFERGDLPAARAAVERAIDALLAPDSPATSADRLHALGKLAFQTSAFPAAERCFRRVLELRTAALPADHPDVLSARQGLGANLQQQGRSHEAHEHFVAVHSARERALHEDHHDLQAARINLAATQKYFGDLDAAQALEEAALAACDRTLPPDHPDRIAARLNLAATLRLRRDLAGARALLERCVEDCRSDDPAAARLRGHVFQNLGAVFTDLGDFAAARGLAEQVLAIRERDLPEGDLDLLTARQNLAGILYSQGERAAARTLLESAYAAQQRSLPPDHPLLLRTRQNLASVLKGTGDVAGAIEHSEAILELLESSRAPDDPLVRHARMDLADALRMSGELAPAIALHLEVVAEAERTLPPGDRNRVAARGNLAACLARGDDGAALEEALLGLARELEAALASPVRLSPREREERAASLEPNFGLLLSHSEGIGGGVERAAFEALESARAASTARRSGAAADEALRERVRDLRSRVHDRVHAAAESGAPAGASDDLGLLIRRRDAAERELLGSSARGARAIGADEIARALGAGRAWIGYRRYVRWVRRDGAAGWYTETALTAFVLREDGGLARCELGPLDAIQAAVERWRAAVGKPIERGIRAPDGEEEERRAGLALRELALDPVLELAGEARDLAVCPDDALHLVDLGALPVEAEGAELVGRRYRIHLRPSVEGLVEPVPPSESPPSLLCAGGIDFNALLAPQEGIATPAAAPILRARERGQEESANWGLLPRTRAEAESIAALFESVFSRPPDLLLGREATKRALLERHEGARYVHVATHGFFAPERARSTDDPRSPSSFEETVRGMAPMTLCGLALAGANRGADERGRVDGVLTAEELAGFDLSACDLAVLSACETNVGIARAGQGIRSLQSALHAAGARSAITSLWKVDDERTRELFEDFYTRIWVKGEGKSEALWGAKMALRRKGAPTRDWAAWVLTGSPD